MEDSAPLLSNGDANDHHLEPRSQPLSEPPTSNTGNNTAQQQPTATGLQQPIQMQTTTGPGQTLMPPQAYPQPTYYVGGFYPPQVYGPDPRMMASPPPVAYITPSQSHTYFYPGHQQVANPVVVQQQPTVVSMSNAIVQPSPGDNYYTLSIIMTILVILLGGWLSIVCTAMAALISYNAKEEERRGNIAAAQSKANISLGLNIAAILFTIVMWSAVAIPVAVTVSASNTASPCYAGYICYSSYCSYYGSSAYSYYSPCSSYYYYSYSSYSYSIPGSYSYYIQYCSSCNYG